MASSSGTALRWDTRPQMASAAAHYEKLLARHYTWMLGGDLEGTAARDREMLEGLGVRKGALAVDLGCGHGPLKYSHLSPPRSAPRPPGSGRRPDSTVPLGRVDGVDGRSCRAPLVARRAAPRSPSSVTCRVPRHACRDILDRPYRRGRCARRPIRWFQGPTRGLSGGRRRSASAPSEPSSAGRPRTELNARATS